MSINGVINLNKRKGISSFKAVREVKNSVGAEKAGHTGTLDPEASGVLPICLGKSTRIVDYLIVSGKEYNVVMYLGIETDTCDLEGEIISEVDVSSIDLKKFKNTINSFKGEIEQVPPIYSAIKVNGRKLYDYARKGEAVEIKPRKVEIFHIKDVGISKEVYSGHSVLKAAFNVGCSKGTYIRSLCRDIGKSIGSRGTMAQLTRTKSGMFRIEDSYSIEEIISAADTGSINEIIIPAERILDIPVIILDNSQYDDYMNGRKVIQIGIESGEYLVKSLSGITIGIGIVDELGKLKSRNRL